MNGLIRTATRRSPRAGLWWTAGMIALSLTLRAGTSEDQRFEIYPFIGEVINNFSSQARADYAPEPAGKESIDRMAGLEWEYWFKNEPKKDHWSLFGRALHSARSMVVECQEGEVDCDNGNNPDYAYKVIRASDTLEWAAGFRWMREFNRGQTGVYIRAQGGFIRAKEAKDDMVDNHFLGLGLEHRKGAFKRSCMEIGVGRTDLFDTDQRFPRLKANVLLVYTPGNSEETNSKGVMGFFIKGLLDTDLGPGSDDYQILTGLVFDVSLLFETFKRGAAAAPTGGNK